MHPLPSQVRVASRERENVGEESKSDGAEELLLEVRVAAEGDGVLLVQLHRLESLLQTDKTDHR